MKKTYRNITIITIIIATIMQVICIFNNNIWFDESYTIGLVNHNMFDLIKIAIADVHPLLYYVLLKIFTLVFGNSIIILKLFSCIPIIILAIIGYKQISKEFNKKIAMYFVMLLECISITVHYAVQIRMYSLAALFIFLTAMYAYKSLKYGKAKYFSIFVLFSLLSSYTHHFAFFTALTIDLFMLIYILFKNKLLIKKYVFSIISQFILFLPGLIIFFAQSLKVSFGFWILD